MKEADMNPTDHIQLVTFQLAGLEPDAYRAHAEAAAPAFTQIPGLRAKAWLANPDTNTYGGVYAWESREAMEAYVSGPIFGALLADPAMAHVRTRDFGVLERATEITRGR
jgi:Putative mono-oxygenase ydhR